VFIVDTQVHIWKEETPDRPWIPGARERMRLNGHREEAFEGRPVPGDAACRREGRSPIAGVSAESIKELADNQAPHFAHADEQLLYRFATQVLADHFVDQQTFDDALGEWGEAGLVDIIGCLGNFSMLAMLLNTFQVDLKPGDPAPFPDVRGFAKVRG
jgi:hypothetical protein